MKLSNQVTGGAASWPGLVTVLKATFCYPTCTGESAQPGLDPSLQPEPAFLPAEPGSSIHRVYAPCPEC